MVRPEQIFSSTEGTSITIINATGLLNFPKTRTNLLHPQQKKNEVGPSPSGMLYYCIFGKIVSLCSVFWPDSMLGFIFNLWVMLVSGGVCSSLLSFVCFEYEIGARHKPLHSILALPPLQPPISRLSLCLVAMDVEKVCTSYLYTTHIGFFGAILQNGECWNDYGCIYFTKVSVEDYMF